MQILQSWFAENIAYRGLLRTGLEFIKNLWQFLVDSIPSRRRQRYGDVDFDWDYRVDTTSATVSWRDRLLGLFLSPYQATDPAFFRDMLLSLNIDFQRFTFIDLGSGKGRTLLMASDFPFKKIIGVELLPALHAIAQENILSYRSDSQRCFALQTVCHDARRFVFPEEPLVLYFFNPLPEAGLSQVAARLEESLSRNPRSVFVLYHNPLLEHVIAASPYLRKLGGTHQYSIYASHPGPAGDTLGKSS